MAMTPKGNPKGGTSNEGIGSGKHFSIESPEVTKPVPKAYPGNGKAQGGGSQG